MSIGAECLALAERQVLVPCDQVWMRYNATDSPGNAHPSKCVCGGTGLVKALASVEAT